MYARVTQIEIDTLRAGVDDAVEIFRGEVLPHLREQPGFAGVIVLATPEGKGLLVGLWDTEEAAEAGSETGFYAETLARYVTLFRSPPGRERYEVALAEAPALSIR
jgi:heme-degrading monooxygenase HmoA